MDIKKQNWQVEQEFNNQYLVFIEDTNDYFRFNSETEATECNFEITDEEWSFLAGLVDEYIKENESLEEPITDYYSYYGVKRSDFI